MSIKTEVMSSFKKGDAVIKLIYFNLAVFLLLKLIYIISQLMVYDAGNIIKYIAVPSQVDLLIKRFWTILTYMFVHENFIHILFNVLNLYWFGKMFLSFFNQKQLVGLYIIGGLFGAFFYVVSYNIFPYFQGVLPYSILYGASASVLAIILATAVNRPNMEIRLVLIGNVKIKFVALFMVLISLFSVTGQNAGGNIAHLGGIFAGYLFVTLFNRGKDLTKTINRIIDFFVNLLARKPKMKVTYKKRVVSDEEWNANKKKNNEIIDDILDKIKSTGYDSLTAEEKKKLFEQGKK